jgi:hypothetical protein
MDRHGGSQLELTISLHGGLYFAIIMDRHEWPYTSLTITLHRGLYLAIKMDRHEGPHTDLTIALHGGLFFNFFFCFQPICRVRSEAPNLLPIL